MTSIRSVLALLALVLAPVLPASAQGTAERAAALGGMDVVSYFKQGGPVRGQEAFHHDFDGARYLFSNAQNKAAFVADPDRYLPQFDGLCTTGLSKGFTSKSDPNAWKIVDGKLYLFSTYGPLPADSQAPEVIAGANRNWAKRK